MNGTFLRIILSSAVLMVTLLGYQNCAKPTHSSGTATLFSLGGCESILLPTFKRTYYPFVRQQSACVACHKSGPGSGFFASDDPNLSLSSFLNKGYIKVSDFAVSSHKTGYTGAQHQAAINAIKPVWAAAEDQYRDCMVKSGVDLPASTPNPTKFLVAKSATVANNNQTITLTWNTGSEFESASNSYPGSFTIVVRGINVNGQVGYSFENPRFVNTSPSAALIKNINVFVNDSLVDGETYLYSERYVPNLANNNSRQIKIGAGGGAFFPMQALGTAVQVKIAIGTLSAADIDFRPVTYQDLTAAGGIFATSCVGCHGASGGVSLAANNLPNLVGRVGNSGKTLVSPFNLLNNYIYQRMTDATAPMPAGGVLPKDQTDRVRDWILDGAPANAAAIAR